MSKQVRWQIPFVSRLGTAYRVDIYDEQDGSWSGVTQLLGGTSPFTTSENDSDDYFEPIRVQTGTIEVCTHDEDGNVLITLDDILPANNIARPVKLWRLLGSGAAGVLEWQGFLSCEAYDQDYTSVPQIIQLPVISVLEAMASVEVDQSKLSGLNTVGTTIQKLLEIFIDKAGISYFSQYYIPTAARGRNIISKYIDATVLFEQKEYNNENSTTYIVSGMSIKDCLARIAVYMGWCCREVSGSLYFFAATESSGYRRYYRQGSLDPSTGIVTFIWLAGSNETAVVSRDIVALLWAGVDHKRTVSQGAKSVGVVAKLEKYDFRLSLPEMPDQNLIHNSVTNDNRPIESYTSKDITFDNRLDFYYEKVHRVNSTTTKTAEGSVDDAFRGCIINSENDFSYKVQVYNQTFEYERYIGAFFAKLSYNNGDFQEGLYIAATNKATTDDTGVVFKIRSGIETMLFNGKLKLTASALAYNFFNFYHNYDKKLEMIIQCGSKYWNGSAWTSTESYCEVQFTNGKAEMDMDITDRMKGEVSVRIRGCILGGQGNAPVYYYNYDLFLTELNVEFEPNEDASLSLRGENKYFRLLDTNFRDEISVGTDLASSLNNQPSPSLIMEDLAGTTPMTELNYGTDQEPDMRRPEVDLLNRLAAYYGAARQRIDLIVEHPTAAPLPLLRLNGISPDSRTYAPLAESRDWQQDISTIKCFETPTE